MKNIYTDIEQVVVEKAAERMNELNYEFLFMSRKTNHPDDMRMYVVLGQRKGEPLMPNMDYAVWYFSYNEEEQKGYLDTGCYDLRFPIAMKIFADKLRYIKFGSEREQQPLAAWILKKVPEACEEANKKLRYKFQCWWLYDDFKRRHYIDTAYELVNLYSEEEIAESKEDFIDGVMKEFLRNVGAKLGYDMEMVYYYHKDIEDGLEKAIREWLRSQLFEEDEKE